MKHTPRQNAAALAWIVREYGKNSGQVQGALKVGPAQWIRREYGPKDFRYTRLSK